MMRPVGGRGNLTSAGGATYGYDLQNRLTTFSGGYIYRNAFGQWLDVNTERQWMVHDDDRTIAEFGYDGTVHRRYVYGPGTDEPLYPLACSHRQLHRILVVSSV